MIPFTNINLEDYFDSTQAAGIVKEVNNELINIVKENSRYFAGGVGMLVMNNPDETKHIIEQVAKSKELDRIKKNLP